jgi:hypothetical protein
MARNLWGTFSHHTIFRGFSLGAFDFARAYPEVYSFRLVATDIFGQRKDAGHILQQCRKFLT